MESAMSLLSRRRFVAGTAALVAGGALSGRASAQAPSGPFTLDPLPYPAGKN
jgi:superoxide dismutase, Fe-Mn family